MSSGKNEINIHTDKALLILLLITGFIGGVMVNAASTTEQGHPLSQIVVDTSLDMQGYSISNVGSPRDLDDVATAGYVQNNAGFSSGKWYKCADAGKGGYRDDDLNRRRAARCSVSCPSDESLRAYGVRKGESSNSCDSEFSWYDSYFQVENLVLKKGGTDGGSRSASKAEYTYLDDPVNVCVTVNIMCMP